MPEAPGRRRCQSAATASIDLGAVYDAAKIGAPAHGYTVLKVAEMLQSEHIRALPADVKRKSIMVALDAAGVKVDRDRRGRRAARSRARHLRAGAAEAPRGAARRRPPPRTSSIEEEITQRVAELRARIDAEQHARSSAEQDELQAWQHAEAPGGRGASPRPSATSCRRIRSRRSRARRRDKGDADVR